MKLAVIDTCRYKHHKSYWDYQVGATWQAVCQFVYGSCNVPLLHPTLFQFFHGAGELEVKVEVCWFFNLK